MMFKRTFWMAAIVAPLCFLPACELVSDAVKHGALKGGYDDGPGGYDNGSGGYSGGSGGSGGSGAYDGAGAKDGYDHPDLCKPLDEAKKAAASCMDPRWEDRDGDGCIDSYACADYTGDVDPTTCKPFPKELLADCKKPLIEDRDNDGCIDYFTCLDEKGAPVGGPDDKQPAMCKPLPPTDACVKPYFEDRDGDGCIDLYVCLDYADVKSDVPPPPSK